MAQEKDTPMPSSTDRSHVIRTSQQWESAIDKYSVIPWGVLCIELTPDGKTKAKVGEGNKFYSQLPYISNEIDLSNYYTKDEVDLIIENLEFMSIKEPIPYDSRNALPRTGNKLGDVRFVKNLTNPGDDPLMYIWNGTKWVFSGGSIIDTDLSEYAKKSEVYPRLQQLEALSHTHRNKNILDETSAVYTVEKDEKLASLKNYDVFVPATAATDGEEGLVPAPLAGEQAKFLRGDGTWAVVDAATNYVEGDAIEFTHPGMTDLGFDFDTFVSKFTGPNNGTVSVDSVDKAFTLTSTGSDAYTNPWAGGDLYTIPVVGGRKYRLTWNSSAPTVGGNVYAFENANTSHMHGVNQADQNYLEFTADTTSNVNFRFGIMNSGNSITFSNIKFYEVDNADPDTNIINVKYGSGLSLDNSNRLQANAMTGADGTNAGTAGIVPAPTATDNTKFLRGDGTWVAVESGVEYKAGAGISITDVGPIDTDYYFDTQVSCNLAGNRLTMTYTKYNTEPAFGAIVSVYTNESFTGPVFVGRTPDSVKYTGNTGSPQGTVVYRDETWYYSTFDGWVDGERVDTLNNMQKIEGLFNVPAQTEDIVFAILDAGHNSSTVVEKEISVVPATTETIGGIIVGDGLEIDEEGVLSASGGRTYVAGDGIMITDSTSFELSEDTVTNTEYFFDTQVTSSISGRTYTKYNTEPALGAVIYASSYTQPFFVGLTADSVKYGTSYDSHIWPNPDHPSFEYKGVTWYYSGNAYGMPGDGTDASGHMQKLSGSYSVSTEADLQNIARAIIDAADIITSPTKIISAKIGEGLSVDNNNTINVNVGDGLEIDANNDINVDISRTTIFFNNNPNS